MGSDATGCILARRLNGLLVPARLRVKGGARNPLPWCFRKPGKMACNRSSPLAQRVPVQKFLRVANHCGNSLIRCYAPECPCGFSSSRRVSGSVISVLCNCRRTGCQLAHCLQPCASARRFGGEGIQPLHGGVKKLPRAQVHRAQAPSGLRYAKRIPGRCRTRLAIWAAPWELAFALADLIQILQKKNQRLRAQRSLSVMRPFSTGSRGYFAQMQGGTHLFVIVFRKN